jgi:hypothetical protein
VACHARSVERPAGPWPSSPAEQTACAACCNARVPRAGRRSGILAGGSTVARQRQDVAGDLEGATGRVPSKEERAGAHWNGGSTVKWRKRRRAAVSNGSGVASVVVDMRGGVLQHRCGRGKRVLAPIRGMVKLRWHHRRWGTAVTLGRSLARRRGSGSRKPARQTPGRWGSVCGARAWTSETNGTRGR